MSIITPLHNKGAYIAETIESVLAQTMSDWEMIIVENGSTDKGPTVAKDYAAKDRRIRFVVASADVRGPGAARNLGLKHALGDWILFLDGDDLIESGHIEHLLGVSKHNLQCAIVAGGWKSFHHGDPGKIFENKPFERFSEKSDLLAGALALTPWVPHVAVVRKNVLTEDLWWPVELDNLPDEDTAFWFRVLLHAEVAWTTRLGAIYRLSAKDSRSSLSDVKKRFEGYHRNVEFNLKTLAEAGVSLNPICWAHLSMMYETHFIKAKKAGDQKTAELSIAEASKWLRLAPVKTLNTLLRKLFGIRVILALKKAIRWQRQSI